MSERDDQNEQGSKGGNLGKDVVIEKLSPVQQPSAGVVPLSNAGSVTFEGETAGYKNAIGSYKIAADGTISDVKILFANASLQGSGGDLTGGKSAASLTVNGGDKVAFFIVPNGFSQSTGGLLASKEGSFKFVTPNGKPGNVNGGTELKLVYTSENGRSVEIKSAYGTSTFHSADDGSKGLNGDNFNHVRVSTNADGSTKIAFEDLKGGGDKDYDDSIITFRTSEAAKAAEKAQREAADKAAAEKAAQEAAAKAAAEKAAQEAAAKAAAEKAAQEAAAKAAAEKAAQEAAAKAAAEKAAQEAAAKAAAEKAAQEAADKAAAEKAAQEAADKAAAEKAAQEAAAKAAAEKAAQEAAAKAAAEKAAQEAAAKAAAEKAAQEAAAKAAAEKAAQEAAAKAAAEKAAQEAADKAAAEKAAQEAADKAAAEKAAQEAADKAAAEKAAQEAADKAAAEKAAQEAADKAAAEKAAQEAADKAAAEKAAQETADKAAAEKAAQEAADKAAAEKAAQEAADKAAAEKAAADEASEHSDLHLGDGDKNKLVGDDHVSVIFGEGGKDILTGNGGDDRIHGGGGDDTITGDDGNDTIFGSSTAGGKADLSNFKVFEATTAHVTFDYESAGYQNTLGVYKIAADGTISGVQVLFANASLQGSGGDLTGGVSSVDVAVDAGQRLGFFVVPNGFAQRGVADLLSDKSATYKFVGSDGKLGNVNGGSELKLVQTNGKGVETVVTSQYGTSIFHSVDKGSSGLNGDNINHAVGTINNIDGTVKIGFEDLQGGGDRDFDDAIFTVSLGTTNTALLAKEATKPGRSSDNDDIKGGAGDDKIFGQADNDKIDGGAGNDKIFGNSGNDEIIGGDGDDFLSGGKGDDIISDGNGNDTVLGNSGNDTFLAGDGNDSYDGGSGFDTLDYSGSSRGINANLNSHTVTGFGNDTVKGVESVIGTRFNDVLTGDKQNNVLVGGDGNDTLRGGKGSDTLTGGRGNDTFVWNKSDVGTGVDHITDFAKGDRLDLQELLKGQKFSNINDVVKVTDSAAGSTLAVKVGTAYVNVVTLDGFHNSSASELLKAGLILV